MAIRDVTITFKADDKDLKRVKSTFDDLNSSAKNVEKSTEDLEKTTTSSFGKMEKGIAKMGLAMVGAFAIKAVVGEALKTIMGFEKAISSLSAITGSTGKDLDVLKSKVMQVAGETKKSATEVAKSFELIGSKAPYLLKNASALADVTKQAIILSKASGEDLVASSGALTGVMNQFNLTASDSGRIINVLAAGSKEGAAPVSQIAAAIDKFGTVAAAANISVEQSVGLTETLAEKNIMGAEAGTQLRNIILKLQAANIGYVDGVFDVNAALQEVRDKNLSAAESAKLFGLESVTAGNILVNNIDKVDAYTKAVTGTNIANEQAAIQTDNLTAKTEELKNQWDNFIVSLDDSSSVVGNFGGGFIDFLSSALTGLQNLDLIWKNTFSGLAEFTQKELERTLAGGWETEAGVNIEKVVAAFDKIPFEKMKGNAKEMQQTWINILGEDSADAIKLFNAYIGQRVEKEKELIKSTKGSSTATDEDTKSINKNTEAKRKNLETVDMVTSKTANIDSVISEAEETLEIKLAKEKEFNDLNFIEKKLYLANMSKLTQEQMAADAEATRIKHQETNEFALMAGTDLMNALRDINNAAKEYDLAVLDEEEQALLEKEEEKKEKEAADLKYKLDNGLISQQQYNDGIKAIEESSALESERIQKETAKKEGEIKRAAFERDRAFNIGEAIMATALGIVKAAPNLALQYLVASMGAVQLGIIATQKTPKFKDGVIDLRGAGTGTSDSIDAKLSRGESVMTAKETSENKGLLQAIRDKQLDEYLQKEYLPNYYMKQIKNKGGQEIVINNQKDISFPKGFKVTNAKDISKPLLDAIEEANFLNQNNKWQ